MRNLNSNRVVELFAYTGKKIRENPKQVLEKLPA